MYKTLAAVGIAAALLFSVPHGASALPGQTTGIKASGDAIQVGYKHRHRYYKHRHWRRGHGHHHNRYYRKRRGIHIHVN
jgi:hypothetical protein